jgi:hypothetical protein
VITEREEAKSVSRMRMPRIARITPTTSSLRSAERLSQNEGEGWACSRALVRPFEARDLPLGLLLFLEGEDGLKKDIVDQWIGDKE